MMMERCVVPACLKRRGGVAGASPVSPSYPALLFFHFVSFALFLSFIFPFRFAALVCVRVCVHVGPFAGPLPVSPRGALVVDAAALIVLSSLCVCVCVCVHMCLSLSNDFLLLLLL